MRARRIHRGVSTALAIMGVVAALGAVSHALAQSGSPSVQAIEQAAGAPVRAVRSPTSGFVTFMATSGAGVPLAFGANAPPHERARAFLANHGAAFGVDVAQTAHLWSHGPDELGMEHARFQQLHGGIPVTGGELTVHLRGAGVVAVNARTLELSEKVVTTPTIGAADALARVEALVAKHFGITDAVYSAPRLEVFNRSMLGATPATTHLAWFVEASRIDFRQFFWIDAHSGRRLLEFSQLTDALNRSIYTADNSSGLPGRLIRSEGQPAVGDLDGDLAYDYTGDTYNYYLTQHGRDSYDGQGAPLVSTVHYCAPPSCPNFSNVFWNGSQMVYGNGFSGADDLVGHELTHAVTERTARLFYFMQSGAMNESYSDIFGETIDLLNGRGNDSSSVRWLIGEDIPGGAIRNMMNPNAFSDPAKMSDSRFVCDVGSDGGGVHTNSGVPNHAYALMVDGGTYNGFTITGIGLIKAGKIQYRALTTYLLSASDFLDNYNAVNQSCVDLVGSAGITSGDCIEVRKALDAVEMTSTWPCATLQAVVPPLCPAGKTPAYVFNDNLENTSSGNWMIRTISGGVPPHWSYPSTLGAPFATSGVQSFWGYDKPSKGDSAIEMTSAVAIPSGARLQFNHAYDFQSSGSGNFRANSDGGVIEYSIDGGATWFDAGNLISAGAVYGGTINASTNPLAGRRAFVRDSYGFTASQLNLSDLSISNLSGRSVLFRFRIGTDDSIDDRGWFIDDVAIYRCVGTSPPPKRDMSADGNSDLIWRHTSGSTYTWFMSRNGTIDQREIGTVDPSWTIQAVGDFNGDKHGDLLWRHSSGPVYVWLLQNGRPTDEAALGTIDPSWTIQGVGDFNGDGKDDILWRHSSGLLYVWLMDGPRISRAESLGTIDPSWTIQGIADFDGDGKADILWRHSSGLLYVWLMNGTQTTGAYSPGTFTADWTIQKVGDFNGDGKADILRRNSAGVVEIWLLDGPRVLGIGSLGAVDRNWVIQKGSADFGGDGKTDILWRHSSGSTYIWFMDGATIARVLAVGTIDPGWVLQ